MTADNAWFKSWFDTKYYHILYQHRDENEAQLFIKNLVNALRPSPDDHILDLACGRGRHAIFLNEDGFEVTGIDLSESNIRYARKFEDQSLHFEVGDMRQSYGENRFNYIFNLFTSFGYFENWEDNLRALKMMKHALKPGGTLVLDFMNVYKVQLGLVKEEIRQAGGIEFHIERFIRDNQVIKKISFSDKGQDYQFEEKVQLLDLGDFRKLFRESGFEIESIYGDFNLSSFDADESERLILFAG